ncbi:MAG TPA: alanine transaminase, partial [Actinomycetes bacterium]
EPPRGSMFVWAPIPEPYRELGSVEFASMLVKEAKVATSPGIGFGPGGDGHVRFALIENEQRVGQAIRNLRRVLTKLG